MGVLRIWAHIHAQCAGGSELNVPMQPLKRAAFRDMHLCRAVALRHSLDPLRWHVWLSLLTFPLSHCACFLGICLSFPKNLSWFVQPALLGKVSSSICLWEEARKPQLWLWARRWSGELFGRASVAEPDVRVVRFTCPRRARFLWHAAPPLDSSVVWGLSFLKQMQAGVSAVRQ